MMTITLHTTAENLKKAEKVITETSILNEYMEKKGKNTWKFYDMPWGDKMTGLDGDIANKAFYKQLEIELNNAGIEPIIVAE